MVQKGKIKHVPKSILELPHLENFDVDKNRIQGLFPFNNNTNTAMLRLDINYNFFQGNLDFLSQLPNLIEAHLDNNIFEGTIPEEIGSMSNLREFIISFYLIIHFGISWHQFLTIKIFSRHFNTTRKSLVRVNAGKRLPSSRKGETNSINGRLRGRNSKSKLYLLYPLFSKLEKNFNLV